MNNLEEFVVEVKESIRKGLGSDAILTDSVVLELSILSEKKIGGGFDLKVVELGSKVKESAIQKITIPFRLLREVDRKKEVAEIAEQDARTTKAILSKFPSPNFK